MLLVKITGRTLLFVVFAVALIIGAWSMGDAYDHDHYRYCSQCRQQYVDATDRPFARLFGLDNHRSVTSISFAVIILVLVLGAMDKSNQTTSNE